MDRAVDAELAGAHTVAEVAADGADVILAEGVLDTGGNGVVGDEPGVDAGDVFVDEDVVGEDDELWDVFDVGEGSLFVDDVFGDGDGVIEGEDDGATFWNGGCRGVAGRVRFAAEGDVVAGEAEGHVA